MRLLHLLAKRFIAGYDFDSAKPVIKKLKDDGFDVSVDYLGELSKSKKDCLKARDEYIKIIKFYENEKIDISVKPSQLGLLIDPLLCYENLLNIASRAKSRGHTMRLDMEDSTVTSATINLAISLNNKFGNVGVALQSNLRRSAEDLLFLIKNKTSVRLVKGAYKEDKELAFQNDLNIASHFFCRAADLYSEKSERPAIATHDEELLEDIREMIPCPHYFEYEFLYGIRRDIQKKYRDDGYKVRIYVPFGEDWLPYISRRLKEWKNIKFVVVNVFREWRRLFKWLI